MNLQLPLVVPRQVVKKSAMLCQVEDEELDLKGDTGAIGRIQFKNDECHIDVKGTGTPSEGSKPPSLMC